jgi:hypothetical protein
MRKECEKIIVQKADLEAKVFSKDENLLFDYFGFYREKSSSILA